MKFGKELINQAIPEWKEYYLNYKKLKGQIKRVCEALEGQSLSLRDPSSLPSFDPPLRSPNEEHFQFKKFFSFFAFDLALVLL